MKVLPLISRGDVELFLQQTCVIGLFFHLSNIILDRDDVGPSTSALDQPTNITPISSPPTVARDSHVETPVPLKEKAICTCCKEDTQQ